MTQNGTSLWQKPQADGIRPLPTGPLAREKHTEQERKREREAGKQKERRKEKGRGRWGHFGKEENITSSKFVPLSQIEQHVHEGKKLLERTSSSSLGQTAASGEKAAAGQDRAGYDTVVGGGGCSCQRDCEAYLASPTNSGQPQLSGSDLTGVPLYHGLCLCAFVCRCMHACTKKKERRSLCVYVRSSRLGDVTRRKPSEHPWPSPQLFQTPHRFLHPPVCLFCCLWQGHAHYSTFNWLHATTTFSLHLNLTSLISLSYMSDPVVSIFCPFCLTYDLKNLLIL